MASVACTDGEHPPAVEGVVSRNDVGAVFACQELDAVVERLHCGQVRLALLNDVQGIPRPPAEQAVLTGRLQAAVWVQAIHQAVWKDRGRGRVSRCCGTQPRREANAFVLCTIDPSPGPNLAGCTQRS